MEKFGTDVKHGGSVGQTRLNIGFATVVDFLGIADHGQQGETGFNQQTLTLSGTPP